MPGSVAAMSGSQKSQTRYRTLNRDADVDETLFGSARNRTSRKEGEEREVMIVGKDTVMVRKKFDRKAKANLGQHPVFRSLKWVAFPNPQRLGKNIKKRFPLLVAGRAKEPKRATGSCHRSIRVEPLATECQADDPRGGDGAEAAG